MHPHLKLIAIFALICITHPVLAGQKTRLTFGQFQYIKYNRLGATLCLDHYCVEVVYSTTIPAEIVVKLMENQEYATHYELYYDVNSILSIYEWPNDWTHRRRAAEIVVHGLRIQGLLKADADGAVRVHLGAEGQNIGTLTFVDMVNVDSYESGVDDVKQDEPNNGG